MVRYDRKQEKSGCFNTLSRSCLHRVVSDTIRPFLRGQSNHHGIGHQPGRERGAGRSKPASFDPDPDDSPFSLLIIYLVAANLFERYGYWAQFLLINICVHGPCGIRELLAGHLNGIMIKASRGSCVYQVLLPWRIT